MKTARFKTALSLTLFGALAVLPACSGDGVFGMFGDDEPAAAAAGPTADDMASQEMMGQSEMFEEQVGEAPPSEDLVLAVPPGRAGAEAADSAARDISGRQQTAAAPEREPGPGPAYTREMMRKVQAQLQQEGYQVGPIDGWYGPRTADALRAWQRDRGMTPSGKLNEPTVAGLLDPGSQPQAAESPEGDQQQQEPGAAGGPQQQEQQQQQQEEDGFRGRSLFDDPQQSPQQDMQDQQ